MFEIVRSQWGGLVVVDSRITALRSVDDKIYNTYDEAYEAAKSILISHLKSLLEAKTRRDKISDSEREKNYEKASLKDKTYSWGGGKSYSDVDNFNGMYGAERIQEEVKKFKIDKSSPFMVTDKPREGEVKEIKATSLEEIFHNSGTSVAEVFHKAGYMPKDYSPENHIREEVTSFTESDAEMMMPKSPSEHTTPLDVGEKVDGETKRKSSPGIRQLLGDTKEYFANITKEDVDRFIKDMRKESEKIAKDRTPNPFM